MSVLAVAIAGLGLAGAQVALTFYLVRWARGGEKKLRDGLRGSQKLKDRIAELDRAVEERDRALDNKVQEAARVAAALEVAEEQRNDAIELVQQLAEKDPEVLTVAMRAQLDRLWALSTKEVPDVPSPAPSEDS